MNKFGIILNNFGVSQLAYFALRNANKFVNEQSDWSVFGFYQNLFPPIIEPQFSLMHSFELYNFGGVLISTDILSTKQSLESFSASRRLFYVWDLEWVRHKKNFGIYEQFYCNPKVELVARSHEHKVVIDGCWNRNCKVVEDFNFNEFVKKIHNDSIVQN